MADPSPVDRNQDGHVLVLRIYRPESMNAIKSRVIDDLTPAVSTPDGMTQYGASS
jgi:enoyl-CoA hydratase/carnithine racemase